MARRVGPVRRMGSWARPGMAAVVPTTFRPISQEAFLNVLFFADVVGRPGRELLVAKLPGLRERFEADVVVANGENVTDGKGLKPSHAEALLRAGVDVITTGNHVWRQRDIYRYLSDEPRVLRPYNFLESNPGRGVTVVDTSGGRLGVVNLLGDLYLYPARSPFEVVDRALEELQGVRNVIVDLHAEATSEKVAMGVASGRPGQRSYRHPHPCAHCRRPCSSSGDRLYHRCGDVRVARLGHRGEEGTGP